MGVTNVQTYLHPLHIKLIIHQLSTKQYCPFVDQVYWFCSREFGEILYILKQLNLSSILENTRILQASFNDQA
jgi:hypothetical protein